MNGIIYVRVSHPDQVQGTSLESQEQACREYAAQHNIRIVRIFIERGESAKYADRTELLQLIDFCHKNKDQLQVLIVWKVDRFARNTTDYYGVKATLLKAGVRIESVTEPIDPTPEGRLMEGVLATIAQFDNDIRALRTIQGMKRKLEEGIFPWKPPLGYKRANGPGEKKILPDVPDEPLFSLLQKAWREFATGAYTKAEIKRLMARWGITTRRGQALSPQSVDNLFSNPYYAGVLTNPWTGGEFKGKHLPLVSAQEFARVQASISKRSRAVPHQKCRPEFPVRGTVRCSTCRKLLTGSFSRGRSQRYPYYHCANRGCPRRGRSIPAGQIEKEFEGFLQDVSPNEESLTKLEFSLERVVREHKAFSTLRHARNQTQLGRLERQTQKLIELKTQDLITDEEFLDQKRELSARRAALMAADEPSADLGQLHANWRSIAGIFHDLPNLWRILPDALRARFNQLLLPAGFVAGSVRTAEKAHLFSLFDTFPHTNVTAVALTGKSWNQICIEMSAFSDLIREYHESESASK